MTDNTRQILIDGLNEVQPLLSGTISYRDDLLLWGGDGVFDSLTLVTFISAVETLIGDTMDKEITIVSEKAFSKSNSPFRSMEIFGDFIEELLGETE